jgi:hypothetical protein
MSRGIKRGNREAKKPKKEKPKQASGGYKSETAMLLSGAAKGTMDTKKRQK